jgi:hypothetical protein
MNYVINEPNIYTNPNLDKTNILFTSGWDIKLVDQDFLKLKTISKTPEETLVREYGFLILELIYEQNLPRKESPKIPSEGMPNPLKTLIKNCFESKIKFSEMNIIFPKIIYESGEYATEYYTRLWDKFTQKYKGKQTWVNLVNLICETLNISYNSEISNTVEFRCIKAILDPKDEQETITPDAFQKLVKCVGPFIDFSESLDHVTSLLKAPWFMGAIAPTEADKLLKSMPALKSFLVRFSVKSGEFSITWKVKDKVMHTRVPTEEKYNLYGYVESELTKKKFEETPPSPYRDIFSVKVYSRDHKFVL